MSDGYKKKCDLGLYGWKRGGGIQGHTRYVNFIFPKVAQEKQLFTFNEFVGNSETLKKMFFCARNFETYYRI